MPTRRTGSAWQRSLCSKSCRLALHRELRWRVAQKLALQWSPEQVSGWLKRQFPTDQDMQISHEAIYRSRFVQTRGVLKGADRALAHQTSDAAPQKPQRRQWAGTHLRYGLDPRAACRGRGPRCPGPLGRRPSYRSERYAHHHTDWERRSPFTMLVKLPRKHTTTRLRRFAGRVRILPEELRRSLTWDQGKEMHAHKRFTVATNVQVYFCDPRSPWQRGSNENTNRLVRQYFPRRTDLARISPKLISMRLPCDSINVRGRLWASKARPINYKRCCTDWLNSHSESRLSYAPSSRTAAQQSPHPRPDSASHVRDLPAGPDLPQHEKRHENQPAHRRAERQPKQMATCQEIAGRSRTGGSHEDDG